MSKRGEYYVRRVGCIALMAVIVVLNIRFSSARNNLLSLRNVCPESAGNAFRPAADRSKRFITYNGGGIVKLVLGTSFPIVLADKMRSLNVFYNFQMQYTPPPIPLYWWSLYNTSTFVARKQRSIERLRQSDNSRSQFYDFMDAMFHRTDNSSGDCLLKVICELARAPLSEDVIQRQQDDLPTADDGDDYGRSIFHGLINTIFTPYFPNVSERYVDAAKAGANGAGCDELYGECSSIDEWLKRLTIVM